MLVPIVVQLAAKRTSAKAGNPLDRRIISVTYRTFFARIDVSRVAGLEEKRRHVLGEERPRLWIHHVEAVVIDQHRLLLQPIGPALRAQLFYDAGTDGAGERRLNESCARLSAPRASYGLRHPRIYLRAYEISARPKTESSRR